MARLSEKEKNNLATNLAFFNNQRHYTRSYVSKMTGIAPRTYDSYLTGEYGASKKNLEKLAKFYKTTVGLLLSDDPYQDEYILRNMVSEYNDMIADLDTDDENTKIERILIDKFGNGFKGFLDIIKSNYIKITYSYDITESDLKKELEEHQLGHLEKHFLLQFQKRYYFSEDTFSFLSTKRLEKNKINLSPDDIQLIKSTINNMANAYIKDDYDEENKKPIEYNSLITLRLGQALFLAKYNKGIFENEKPQNYPITVNLVQDCISPVLSANLILKKVKDKETNTEYTQTESKLTLANLHELTTPQEYDDTYVYVYFLDEFYTHYRKINHYVSKKILSDDE